MAERTSLHAYIVVSLLTGARTEELRALTWSHVDFEATPPVIMVWRSVRAGGDTKTRKSRRTLELPSAASTHFASTATTTSYSPHAPAPHSTRGTSGGRFARLPRRRVSTPPTGRRASYGTASSR